MNRAIKDEINQEVPQEIEKMAMPQNPNQLQISEEMQNQLVDIVMEDYETAKTHRDQRDYGTDSKGTKPDFEKWRKGLLDLYNSERIPKTIPWKFCSNRSLRIAKAILDTLHSRLYPSIVNEYLIKFKADNATSFYKLDRIEKLMHWWLFVHSKIQASFDDWIKIQLGFGDAVVESSWSASPRDEGKTEENPVVGPDNQPLMNPDGTPAVVKKRIISMFEKTVSKIYTRDRFFLQKGSVDIEREPVVLKDDFLYRDLEEGEVMGKFVNVSTLLKERIPFNKKLVEGLAPGEAERIRDIKIRNEPVEVLKWYGSFDSDGDGFAEDVRVYINPEHKIYLGGIQITKVTKSGRRPIDFSKIESRIENPEENWGYGILECVKELAEEIDAIFNQMSDANTLMILTPGFYDPGGDLEAGSLYLQPNKITPVSDPQRNMYFPQINSPIEKMIAAIRLVIEFIERLTGASSYVMGKESEIVGGSGTATRTNAIMASANERFGLPAERLRRGAANIIRQHLDLLQLNIPQGLEQRILGDDGNPIFSPNELSQLGIAGEYDCFLLPDPSAGSKGAEQQIAQMFYSILMQNPLVATNPVSIYKLTADFIKAYGKNEKEYIGPAPDADMVDDPDQENTLMIQGDFGRVTPQFQENHQMHIKKHTDLMQSPSLFQIPPMLANEIVGYAKQHIQQHMMMMQVAQSIMMKGAKGGKPGGEGTGNSAVEGVGGKPTLENAPGPLGEALNSKRVGESSGGQGQQIA